MKRRHDLVPKLVETVKEFMTHERGILEAVTHARAVAMSSGGGPGQQAQAESVLQGALRSLFAVAERCPELKAERNFLALRREVADIEHRIQSSRRSYNGNVRELNSTIERFPSNLVARRFEIGRATVRAKGG